MFKDALREWLGSYEWTFFITQTFRNPVASHHGISALDRTARSIHWAVSKPGRLFLGTELHQSRFLHVHGLLEEDSLLSSAGRVHRASLLEATLTQAHGWARVRPVRNKAAVSAYCTKYVTKALTEWNIW